MRVRQTTPGDRRAAAAAELAVVLPLLLFVLLVTIDFGRLAKYQITVENASRNGALYGSGWDKNKQASNQTDTAGIYNAAYADITNNLENLQSGDVTITSKVIKDAAGYDAVDVGVTVRFRPLFSFSVVYLFDYSGAPLDLTEHCVMRVRPRQ